MHILIDEYGSEMYQRVCHRKDPRDILRIDRIREPNDNPALA
jgi:hypothetical protein